MNRRWNVSANILVCLLSFSIGSSIPGQKSESGSTPQRDAPPEVTILQHKYGSKRRFVNQTRRNSGQEPTTQVITQSVPIISVKVRSISSKAIVGFSWFLVFEMNNDENYSRMPFITAVDIKPNTTKTFYGEIDIESLPRHPRTITVDELKNPPATRPKERIEINCVLFSDGTTSPLNDAAEADCQRLRASSQIRKK